MKESAEKHREPKTPLAHGYSREIRAMPLSIHGGRAWLKKFPTTRVIQWLEHAQERLSCRRRLDNQVLVSDPLFPKQKDSPSSPPLGLRLKDRRLVALPPTLPSIHGRSALRSFFSSGNQAIPERGQQKGRERSEVDKGWRRKARAIPGSHSRLST